MGMVSETRDYLYKSIRDKLSDIYGSEMALGLHQWLENYKIDPSFLGSVYRVALPSTGSYLMDGDKLIAYRKVGDDLTVSAGDKDWSFPIPIARTALQLMIDVMEDYLPLRSVVDLRETLFGGFVDTKLDGELRIVITQRMAALPDKPVYFGYSGVAYPFDIIKGAELLYFTPSMIKNVVHKGYSDSSDEAYLTAVKTELIIKQGYCSYDFAEWTMKNEIHHQMRVSRERNG